MPASLIHFDEFSLDCDRYELLRSGRPVKLERIPMELLILLATRDGNLVTRQEIIERLWGERVFLDTEHGINTAIRKIRLVLKDDPEKPRFVQTVTGKGYRFVAGRANGNAGKSVLSAVEAPSRPQLQVEAPGVSNNGAANSRKAVALSLLVGGIVVGIVIALALVMRYRTDPPVQRALTRITFESGLQIGTTWSPDGRFLAYSSNRGGKLDIWLQQANGGDPIQVTHGPGTNWQPDWSPDGKYIAFRSERSDGGLFVVPALGGAGLERKVSSFGYYPTWSPDSSRILFQTNRWGAQGGNRFYLVGLDGLPPRQVLGDVLKRNHADARSAAWHPDGKRLTVWIWNLSGAVYGDEIRFWTVTIANEEVRRTELGPQIAAQLHDLSLTGQPEWEDDARFRWAPSGDALYFERTLRGAKNLWKLKLEPLTLRATAIERLTTDADFDMEFALSRDGRRLAFTAENPNRRVWLFPFDPIRGRLMGGGEPVTSTSVEASVSALTHDGTKLVYAAMRAGRWELWDKSLLSGQERPIIADDNIRGFPTWSPDGKFLAYWHVVPSIEREQLFIWSAETRTESPASPAGDPGLHWNHIAFDWSPDGRYLLDSEDSPATPMAEIWRRPAAVLNQSSEAPRKLASDPNRNLWQPHFSPDGKWIVVEGERLRPIGDESRLFIIPGSGGELTPLISNDESDNQVHWDDKPRWSQDGNTIYYLSDRSGLFNIWGLHFDPAKGKAVGRPFQISHFDNPDLMVPPAFIGRFELSIARNKLVLNLSQRDGNIWILENVDK